MIMTHVLVVDDEPQIRRFLETGLAGRGYAVTTAPDGQRALDALTMVQPDLMILDLAMPGIDGLAVLRRMREWTTIPVIILSVRDDDAGKVEALDIGADDYLVKPFSMNELLARIRVALRHSEGRSETPTVLIAQDVQLDLVRRVVTLKGEEIHLTPTEYELLRVLMTYADRVVTQQQLLRTVWGVGYEDDIQTLRIFVAQLRRKLKEPSGQPHYIQTEPGVGYRIRSESW
jgi:two-component system KDP operon response regulator KdpE